MSWEIKRLDPPLPMKVGKDKVHAHFLIDYGYPHDLVWVCEVDGTGECWCVRNPSIRFQANWTAGTQPPPGSVGSDTTREIPKSQS